MSSRIFITEDHALMRKSLVEAIEREPGLTVCGQAENIHEALDAILSSRPDLVLTDVELNSSSGLDLIKSIREQAPTLPVVAISMFDVRRNERLAREAGASGFVSKHEGPDKLIATVHEVLTTTKETGGGCNMKVMNVTETELAASPALRGLKPEYLAILAQGAEKQVFAPGDLIIRQGQPANRMFLLQEGAVVLEWHRPGQKSIPVHIAGPGEIVGWSWLFPPFVSHFQARVVEPVKVYALNGGSLLATCEKNCRFGFELMTRLSRIVIDRLQCARKQAIASNNSTGVAIQPVADERRRDFEARPLKKLLVGHPFLNGMSAERIQYLSDSAMEVQFDAGQALFTAGDTANRFYLIVEGSVALQSRTNGTSHCVETIGNGDVLGWSWLYEPYQWHFDARAEKPTRAVFIYGTRLRELCQADPCFGFDLLKRVTRVVIQRLEKLCEHLPA